jgi:hypothetical protein
VTRSEFNRLTDVVNQCVQTLDVQFKRMAQMQAEIDRLLRSLTRRASRPR